MINAIRRRLRAITASDDEGFTLVEVIWALFLLGLIAMAALGLFINGMKSIAHVQKQQAAVALANSAMDKARSVSSGAVTAVGTIGTIKGRSESAVKAVWTDATSLDATDTADMNVKWDPETGLAVADQWVPVRTTAVVDNQTYTIDTLVGTCYRLKAASGTSQNCVKDNPAPISPTADAHTGTYIEMYRVRVVVRWDESSDGSAAQSYRLSTLIDPTADATWNTVLMPYAYDDEFSVAAGSGTTYHAIVANDSVDYNESGTTSPVKNLSAVSPSSAGSVAINTAKGVNGVDYTAPTTVSGKATFTYKVQGTSGEISVDPGTVTVHVLPTPVVDNFYVASGSTTVINNLLTGNDFGVTNIDPTNRKTTIVPAWVQTVDQFATEDVTQAMLDARAADKASLAAAGITVSGTGDVTFTAPSTETTTEFWYYLVDDPKGSGIRYPNPTPVKVKITTENSPTSKAITKTYPAAPTTAQTIDWRTETGNPTGTKIRVTNITGPGTPGNSVKIDGNAALNATGTALTFIPSANIGNYVITYQTVSPSGTITSAASTITVSVVPVPPAAAVTSLVSSSGTYSRTYDVSLNPTGTTNDFNPNSGLTIKEITRVSGNCSATITQPTTTNPLRFTITYTATSAGTNCVLTYKTTWTATTPAATYVPQVLSATATMTVTR
ncbi:type IV pilus modification PilV family protein [Demequina sp.]|uniref:type IV pilus modification PilV family protein n=1 Tax=Demequina sp. TaxID=2050685 RepID=UPI003D13A2A6